MLGYILSAFGSAGFILFVGGLLGKKWIDKQAEKS